MIRSIRRFYVTFYIFFFSVACKQDVDPVKSPNLEGTFVRPKGISFQPFEDQPSFSNHLGMILVPSGVLSVYDDKNGDSARVYVESFFLDSTEVTVHDFAEFINTTNYKTDAEKFGNAGVFDMGDRSWSLVDSAHWRYPQGKNKAPSLPSDPVTQVSWFDAKAYCAWKGKRLPNELEWEHAARNGRNDAFMYSWGDEWSSGTTIYGNVWQGDFPEIFKNLDGYERVAPVKSFRASPLGFFDLSGNVWEWCDNWRFDYESLNSGTFERTTEKVIRGGSFLCAPNYCHGYKISSRSFTTPETSLFHIGCRCAMDLK